MLTSPGLERANAVRWRRPHRGPTAALVLLAAIVAPASTILVVLGTVAFLVVVWTTVGAATYTLGAVVDRARVPRS